MIQNYLKIAWRNLVKNKTYSFINIAGLSVGMAVAMLICLWVWDELSFDRSYPNYDKIARVMQNQTNNGEVQTMPNEPLPLGNELRRTYGSDFKYVSMATGAGSQTLAYGEKKLNRTGVYFEPCMLNMLSIKMLNGTYNSLNDANSILLSASVAKTYFGNTDPMDKVIEIDNQFVVKVTGIYQDLPLNSTFGDVTYILPWQLYVNINPWMKGLTNNWGRSMFYVYAQVADNADMDKVSFKIRKVKLNKAKEEATHKPEIFLHLMSKWHLYSEFKNGVNVGGSIQYVWLFGVSGLFVLLLACINFMNLSTARYEKRAKEVGIRKVAGSLRRQLILQFFAESLLVSAVSFLISLFLVQISLPFFNRIADKNLVILWHNPSFWLSGLGFSLITGLLAGSYPAIYLSSFKPALVLKGAFKAGRFAAIPRKALVVLQFTVSITLIIGTIVVFRQIQFAKDRPIGYNQNGLISVHVINATIHNRYNVVRNELLKSGAITAMAESGNPITSIWSSVGDLEWKGKDPNSAAVFPKIDISHQYGKTVGWRLKEGRDFSEAFTSDSSAFVINEAAAKYMGLSKPIGEVVIWNGTPFHIIGVTKDITMESPYQAVQPAIFHLSKNWSRGEFIMAKINPAIGVNEAVSKIEKVFKKYNPAQIFEYQFVDDDYAQKFGSEKRTGTLASSFAILAIFISCLGLFGMASFMAEQRIKEIGVRKVLGASVFNLWQLLSKDFVILIVIALLIASPIAYYSMYKWLQNYRYHSNMAWWIFALTGIGAMAITLLTVSFQSIKAALANPAKSLKTE
ncbi:MAG: FtsX-like permease family protein [Mucilaginibacter sp.]|nr:FtsX-like permease family protein [Mucilaginibacter sp.]